MTLLASLRAHRLASPLRSYEAVYSQPEREVAAEQLRRLNAAWRESLVRSPWARELRKRLNLPESFPDWETFRRLTPIQRKADLRSIMASRTTNRPPVLWRATGGTTAEPLRFPVFPSEANAAALDLWLGRKRLGIAPRDRLFMIWGHSHVFGSGLKGAMARLRRKGADKVLGYTRWNAYRLSTEDLNDAANSLLQSRARYIIGYSSALDRFARENINRSAEFRKLSLVGAIATAEGFPRSDSREVISGCLGCPVFMEYGAVETGPIAYERPSGPYDVFWAHHRLEVTKTSTQDDTGELAVTSLTPRALPLLRYATGDLVRRCEEKSDCITTFHSVVGRCNDVVLLPNGKPIHSEAFTHTVRDIEGLRAYQIVCRTGRLPLIRWEAESPPPLSTVDVVKKRLAQVDPLLRDVDVEWTPSIPPSLAGKHRMVIGSTS